MTAIVVAGFAGCGSPSVRSKPPTRVSVEQVERQLNDEIRDGMTVEDAAVALQHAGIEVPNAIPNGKSRHTVMIPGPSPVSFRVVVTLEVQAGYVREHLVDIQGFGP
ncbi:MAG: hypothetical protein ACKV0T_27720 [Planctomycetales bacterium]